MQKKTFKRNIITHHISENRFYYICIFVVFSLGLLIGACTATSFDTEYIGNANEYFSSVPAAVKSIESPEMFRKIMITSIKELLAVWCSGMIIFGIIPVLYTIFKRGFILGVTVTLIINFTGDKGILIAGLLMLFQCILFIPVLFFTASSGMKLSAEFLNKLVSRSNHNFDFKSALSGYILIFVICFIAIIMYSLLESFVSFSILKRCFIT